MPQASSFDLEPAERGDAVEHDQRAGRARRAGDAFDRLSHAGRGLGVHERHHARPHARDRLGHRVVVEDRAGLGRRRASPARRRAARPRTCARRRRPPHRSRPDRPARADSRGRLPCRRSRFPRAAASCGSRFRTAVAGPPARGRGSPGSTGSRWPSIGSASARRTRGWTFEGPGPSSRRRGGMRDGTPAMVAAARAKTLRNRTHSAGASVDTAARCATTLREPPCTGRPLRPGCSCDFAEPTGAASIGDA